MDQDLLRTALRVLSCYTSGQNPAAPDIELLRLAAGEATAGLGPDDLAIYIVEREIEGGRMERRAASS
jgi:hypothetical protein